MLKFYTHCEYVRKLLLALERAKTCARPHASAQKTESFLRGCGVFRFFVGRVWGRGGSLRIAGKALRMLFDVLLLCDVVYDVIVHLCIVTTRKLHLQPTSMNSSARPHPLHRARRRVPRCPLTLERTPNCRKRYVRS